MTDKIESESNKKSVWEQTAILPQFPKLDGDMQTDVLIIGGGITGILTAYFLHQSGVLQAEGTSVHPQSGGDGFLRRSAG